MSYEALTRHLEALRRAQPWSADEAAKRDAYAAVALAAERITREEPQECRCSPETTPKWVCPFHEMKDALDALQKALT